MLEAEFIQIKKGKATSEQSPTESFKNKSTNFPWLISSIDDLEQRMKTLVLNMPEGDDNAAATFKERAESYYEERPQLLALLQDLYNGYLALSDKYTQALARQNRHARCPSTASFTGSDFLEDSKGITLHDSDAESSLSYQQPPILKPISNNIVGVDALVAELVIKNVEFNILTEEASAAEKRYNDSSRKIELQKSLVEVLESERLILLKENARLCFKVATLMEENKELGSESLFVKMKASEMARCLLRVRDEQRVGMLDKKVEYLQERIQGLEKKNMEYAKQLAKMEFCEKLINEDYDEKNAVSKNHLKVGKFSKKKMKNDFDVKLKTFLNMGSFKPKRESTKRKSPKWWKKIKNMDFFLCSG